MHEQSSAVQRSHTCSCPHDLDHTCMCLAKVNASMSKCASEASVRQPGQQVPWCQAGSLRLWSAVQPSSSDCAQLRPQAEYLKPLVFAAGIQGTGGPALALALAPAPAMPDHWRCKHSCAAGAALMLECPQRDPRPAHQTGLQAGEVSAQAVHMISWANLPADLSVPESPGPGEC